MSKEFFYGWALGLITSALGLLIVNLGLIRRGSRRRSKDQAERLRHMELEDFLTTEKPPREWHGGDYHGSP